jgi:hypothetical protein
VLSGSIGRRRISFHFRTESDFSKVAYNQYSLDTAHHSHATRRRSTAIQMLLVDVLRARLSR